MPYYKSLENKFYIYFKMCVNEVYQMFNFDTSLKHQPQKWATKEFTLYFDLLSGSSGPSHDLVA